MSDKKDENHDRLLDKIDPDRREIMGRILKTTAFAAPVVASFNLDGLSVNMAHAQSANGSGFVMTGNGSP